ncbi:uncharacterized protein LOC129916194 [Episyrphus balteatus]|uniref:uncharacterized protein LOC129916194 n=1 Tax=Episyrphus balteatus TaxID=286459 RepID=UPI002485A99F|nr:uncharacterized protein LOC129916194 [Episyrphus balteatus]
MAPTQIDTNWDVDYYKAEHESEEHWNLRKKFMLVHRHKFTEDEIVCLAQVFTNVEFMGCKYPDETMRLVGELSQEVAKEFREERSKKIKRTFVKASDAAEARAKVRRKQPVAGGDNDRKVERQGFGASSMEVDDFGQSTKIMQQKNNLMRDMKYGNFVLYLIGGRNCFDVSGKKCNIPVVEKESKVGDKKQFEIHIGNTLIAKAQSDNIKTAKAEAFEMAMTEIRKHCYVIKMNPDADVININKTKDDIVANVKETELIEKKLDSNNLGYKMMKMMGWSGGGLGSKTQGREDPVGYLLRNHRSGLGTTNKNDTKHFRQILDNYVKSNDIKDLCFESTFSKEDRATLHLIAGKMNLKSVSHGKAEARSLVISKKTITSKQILTEVLINQNPTFSNKYFIQVPPNKAKEYPNHTEQLDF